MIQYIFQAQNIAQKNEIHRRFFTKQRYIIVNKQDSTISNSINNKTLPVLN